MQAVEEMEKSFKELIHFIEMRQRSVQELTMGHREAAGKKAEKLLGRLDEELADLNSRDAELQHLEQLSQADNDIYFLQVSTNLIPKNLGHCTNNAMCL